MVALREQPAVAAVRLAELDDGRRRVALAVEVLPADVALERDAAHDAVLEPDRLRDDAVRAVRADERVRDDVRLPHLRRDPFGADLEPVDAGVVPERRAGSCCLLREVRVEPPPLGHQDQRLGRGALEAALVVEPELEGVDDALDHRRDVARRLLQRPAGEPATAGLVAWEACAVGEQHALAAAREMDRRRRSGRPGTDDEDIEVLHRSIVGRAAGREPRVRLRRPARRRPAIHSANSGSTIT